MLLAATSFCVWLGRIAGVEVITRFSALVNLLRQFARSILCFLLFVFAGSPLHYEFWTALGCCVRSTSAATKRSGFAVSFWPSNSSRGGISKSTQHALRIVEGLHCKGSVFRSLHWSCFWILVCTLSKKITIYQVPVSKHLRKPSSAPTSESMPSDKLASTTLVLCTHAMGHLSCPCWPINHPCPLG